MSQIARSAQSGKFLEAFSATDAEWAELCAAPKGAILMPRLDWPAIPKTSVRGLRFFAHHPGYTGILPKRESYAHTRLKIDVVKTARALGYEADLEVAGSDPTGNQWIADTLVVQPNGGRMVFEIQLSSQHLQDFRLRTERYRRSSVECCWIISERPVGARLSKALCYDNIDYYREYGEFQADVEDLVHFGVQLDDKDAYPDKIPYLRFSRGKELRLMPMSEAILGMLNGLPKWQQPMWIWGR